MSSQDKQLKNYVDLYSTLGWNSFICHSQFLNLASDFPREYDGACLQMRISYSPAWKLLENAASHQPIARNTAVLFVLVKIIHQYKFLSVGRTAQRTKAISAIGVDEQPDKDTLKKIGKVPAVEEFDFLEL